MTSARLNSTQPALLAASLLVSLLTTTGCGGEKKAACMPLPCPSSASWDADTCACKPDVDAGIHTGIDSGLHAGFDAGMHAATDAGLCKPLPCPSNAPWSAETCACKRSDEAGECKPLPCPSGAPWNAETCTCDLRPDAGTCAEASCEPNVDAGTCDLDAVFASRLGNTQATDCGELAVNASKEQFAAARDCVAAALKDKKPVRLVQKRQGIDSYVANGWLVDASGGASLLFYDSDPSGGSHVGAQVGEQQCASLSIKDKCEPNVEDLCIACDPPTRSALACSEG